MKNSNCNDGQCSTQTNNDQCNTSDCSDKKEGCCVETMMCDLVCTAKCAKKELLKEKMKVRLESKVGKKLDKVADLAVDSLLEMCAGKSNCSEQKAAAVEKLKSILSE